MRTLKELYKLITPELIDEHGLICAVIINIFVSEKISEQEYFSLDFDFKDRKPLITYNKWRWFQNNEQRKQFIKNIIESL